MGKKNIIEELKNFMNNKNVANLVIVLLIFAFLWLALDTFTREGNIFGGNNNSLNGAQEVSVQETLDKQMLDYEEEQEDELAGILSKMEGVGEVEVMMYFESGEVMIPAVDESTQVSTTHEDDSQGGSRVTEQETSGTNIVMGSGNGDSEPFILQTYKPPVTGVTIIAEGAGNSKIKYDIQLAVSTLYNLNLEKVYVYPMGS